MRVACRYLRVVVFTVQESMVAVRLLLEVQIFGDTQT